MQRYIEVIIAANGETVIQTKGYEGRDCLQASKWLEEALGVLRAERKTAEYYQADHAEQRVQQ